MRIRCILLSVAFLVGVASKATTHSIPSGAVDEVGSGGRKIVFTPNGSKMVVSRGSEIDIMDYTQQPTAVSTVNGFSDASGLAITSDGSRVLVADKGANVVVIINTRSSVVSVEGWLTPGDPAVALCPTCVAITPDGTKALVGNNGSMASQYRVAVLTMGPTVTYDYAVPLADGTGSVGAMNIVITPRGERALVVQNTNNVYVLDVASGPRVAFVQDVAVGCYASSIAVTPDGTLAIVTNYLDQTLSVFDPSQPYIFPGYTVATSGFCYDSTISPDGKRAFVANWDHGSRTGSLDVFDLTLSPRIQLVETKTDINIDVQ